MSTEIHMLEKKQKKNSKDAVLHIRVGDRYNFPHFPTKTHDVTHSLEPSRQDDSNEGSQHMFSNSANIVTDITVIE